MAQYKVDYTDREGYNCSAFVLADNVPLAEDQVRRWSHVQPGCRVFAYPATLNVYGVVEAAMHRGGDVAAFLSEMAGRHSEDWRECMEAYRAYHAEWSERCYQASLPGVRAAAAKFARTWIRDGD